MLLKLAILAVLDEAPRIGHHIRRRVDDIAGLSLAANQGQVYATLARLTRAGMIARTACDGDATRRLDTDRAERRRRHGTIPRQVTYALRPRGAAQLRAWCTAPIRLARPRDELLARISFLLRDGDRAALARLVAAQRSAIGLLASRIGDAEGAHGASPRLAAARLAAHRHLAAELAWLDRVAELAAAREPDAGDVAAKERS